MTDLDRLLAAVLAHPAEDVPRLMYADEVQESDPARAELIRVQIELANFSAAVIGQVSYHPACRSFVEPPPHWEFNKVAWTDVQRAAELIEREAQLLTSNHGRWAPPLGTSWDWTMRRGFAACGHLFWYGHGGWERNHGKLLRAHPLERIVFYGARPTFYTNNTSYWLSGMLRQKKKHVQDQVDVFSPQRVEQMLKVYWPKLSFGWN